MAGREHTRHEPRRWTETLARGAVTCAIAWILGTEAANDVAHRDGGRALTAMLGWATWEILHARVSLSRIRAEGLRRALSGVLDLLGA